MRKTERVQYEVLVKVRDFGVAHSELFPESSTAGELLAVVDAAADAARASATARLGVVDVGLEEKAVARAAVKSQLVSIARTARVLATDTPGASARFKVPAKGSDVLLLTAAHAFLNEAESNAAMLASLGVSDTFLDELRSHVGAFEQAMAGRRAAKAGAAVAQDELVAALARGMNAVRKLDVLITNTHRGNAVLLEAWTRARRVTVPARGGVMVVAPESAPPATTPAADLGPAPQVVLQKAS